LKSMAGSTSTSNTYIAPSDGWTQISSTVAGLFLRVSGFPHTHPYYLYFGASAPSLQGVRGTGTVTFSGLPTAGQVVTIGTETYTFRAARALPFEVTIGADATTTGDNFVTAVTTDSQLVTATNSTGTVTLLSKLIGPGGNFTLTENAANTAVSGATMTTGAYPVAGVLMCHKPFVINQAFVQPVWARTANPVPNSSTQDGKLRLDVVVSTSA
jgi:hypothetical protein